MSALINQASGVCLEVHASDIRPIGGRVRQWEYSGTDNQHWESADIEPEGIWLRNAQSGKSLEVDLAANSTGGARVQQGEYKKAKHQHWVREDVDETWFWLRNQHSEMALDVVSHDIAKNGAEAQQHDYQATANQHWRFERDPNDAQFLFGPFEFDEDISAAHVLKLFERHQFAHSRIATCSSLTHRQRDDLLDTYNQAIRHSVSTVSDVNGQAIVGGSQIWINFDVLFPKGSAEIAQTLIHEMMHCAGYAHPLRRGSDTPGDDGPYYGSAPLQAEICVAGVQSDKSCSVEDGRCVLR